MTVDCAVVLFNRLVRTRQMARKLKDVETLPGAQADELLGEAAEEPTPPDDMRLTG